MAELNRKGKTKGAKMKQLSYCKLSNRLNQELLNYTGFKNERSFRNYNGKYRPITKKMDLFNSGRYMDYIEHFVLMKHSKKNGG